MKDRIKDNYEIIIGGFIIAATALFIWFFSYMNEPIGDDILFSYENGLAFYLDDYDLSNLGERITSVSQVFSLIGFFYTHWSGRMTGYSIEIFGKLLPKIVLAFITSTVLSENALSPIIGLFGFVFTSAHGEKFKFIPYSLNSQAILVVCSFKNSSPF